MGLPLQVGCFPDQVPYNKQLRVGDPTTPYPVLHVYVAVAPTSRTFTLTSPSLGLFNGGHTPEKYHTTRNICMDL